MRNINVTLGNEKKLTLTVSDKCSMAFWIVVLSILANALGI